MGTDVPFSLILRMKNGKWPTSHSRGSSEILTWGPRKCGGGRGLVRVQLGEPRFRRVHAPGILPDTPSAQAHMHTHHARVPVGGRLGVALQVKGCTCGALGSHARFSQRGVSSTPPCRGLLASLPHVVPSAGRHQPGNPPVQGRHSRLQYLRSHVAGGRASQMYTNHVRRLVSRAQVCPLSLFRTLTFKIWGPQGCQAALWPWDVRDVVPARGLSSQLSACLSVWPQEEPGASLCLLALGPHLEQGSPP